jgi:hypothetical protein
MLLSLLVLCALSASGCKPKTSETETPNAVSAPPKPKEIPPILGGTTKLRIQVDFSVNPPYVGLNAADVWVTDPSKTLLPVANAKVLLTMTPPSGTLSPPVKDSVVTNKDGKATAHLGVGVKGTWTLTAQVSSPKNGKLALSTMVPVRLLPGQEDNSVHAPVGPVRPGQKGQ